MLKNFLIVLALLLFSFVPANSREITNGKVTVPRPQPFVAFVMNFSGTDFSVAAGGSNLLGIGFAPCTRIGVLCTAGMVVNLSAFSGQWGFSDVSGTMTIDGTQYFIVHEISPTLPFISSGGSVRFVGGSVEIPFSDAPTITLKAPFSMEGFLSARAVGVLPFGIQFSGSGTAFLVLDRVDFNGSDIYLLQRLTYRFGLPVDVDIKPSDDPNHINLRSRGKVPVAILSTALFDATAINPLTVAVAGAPVNLKPNGTAASSLQDINGDGLLDMIVHVDITALQLTNFDNETLVEGLTFDGKHFWGTDTIQ